MMAYCRFIFAILFGLTVSNPAFTQNQKEIDSLLTSLKNVKDDTAKILTYVELYRLTINNDVEQAAKYCRELIQFSKSVNNKEGIAQGYYRYGITFLNRSEYDSSNYYYQKALEIYEETKSENLAGVVYYNLGLNFFEISRYDSAIKYNEIAAQKFIDTNDTLKLASTYEMLSSIYNEKGSYQMSLKMALKASEVFLQYGDQLRLADTYLKIGDGYQETEQYDLSKDYYVWAFQIYKKENDEFSEAMALSNIGSLFIRQNQYDSARKYLFQSLEINERLEASRYIVDVTSSIGLMHFKQKEYQNAIEWFERSNELGREIGFNLMVASNDIFIGQSQVYLGDYISAEENLKRGLQVGLETESKENIRQAYLALSELYEKKGEFNSSLDYYKKYKAASDSIHNFRSKGRMAELQTIYETEKKEKEIKLRDQEIKLLNSQAKAQRLEKSFMILGFGAFLVIVILVIINIVQLYRKRLLLSEQEKINFEKELDYKKKELTVHTLHLVQKNDLLEGMKEKLTEIKKHATINKNEIGNLIRKIKSDEKTEQDWDQFHKYFHQVHENFDTKLRAHFNDLTNNEIRLAALLKMNLTTKEIASILNISPDSVNKARYRLRKKLNLSSEDSLHDFILAL